MKKLVLVEGHPLMRLGLHTVLSRVSDTCTVISVGLEDVDELADVNCAADLVVLGLPADSDECYEAMAVVDELLRPERMLLLSESPMSLTLTDGTSPTSIYACIEKKSSIDTFIAAVQMGMSSSAEGSELVDIAPQNKPWPPPPEAADHMSEWDAAHSRPLVSQVSICDDDRFCLTPRQNQVLELLARGHPIKTVARMLEISTSTAKSHASSIYRQLNVSSRDEAVYAAHRLGILLN